MKVQNNFKIIYSIDLLVAVETDFVAAVHFLQRCRMQVCNIGYIFSGFQTIPMSYSVPAASQSFNAVEKDVRMAV